MEIIEVKDNHTPEFLELWKEFWGFHKDIAHRFLMRKDPPSNWEKHTRGLMRSKDNQIVAILGSSYIAGYSTT